MTETSPSPPDLTTLIATAETHAEAGRYEQAGEAYRAALELDPGDADLHNDLATVYEELGQYDRAEAGYRHALTLNPAEVTLYENLASMYVDRGRSADAAAVYADGLRHCSERADQAALAEGLARLRAQAPETPTPPTHDLVAGAEADLQAGHYEQAADAYLAALGLDPWDADLHNDLATVYEKLGRYDDATAEYWQALAISPADVTFYENLAGLYADLGRPADAVAVYQDGLRHCQASADHAALREGLARLHARMPVPPSRRAHYLAAALLLVGIVYTVLSAVPRIQMWLHNIVYPGGPPLFDLVFLLEGPIAAAVTIVLDLVLAAGLFAQRRWARYLALARAVLGAVLAVAWPYLLKHAVLQDLYEGAQGSLFGAVDRATTLAQVVALVGTLGYCGALALLLSGRTRPWRIGLAAGAAALFVLQLCSTPVRPMLYMIDVAEFFPHGTTLVLAPDMAGAVSTAALSDAQQILSQRYSGAQLAGVRVDIDAGRLRVHVHRTEDTGVAMSLATRIGECAFLDSPQSLPAGSAVPPDLTVVLAAGDVSEAMFSSGGSQLEPEKAQVHVWFTPEGKLKLATHTTANVGRFLVLACDDQVVIALRIRSAIPDAQAVLDGLDEAEARLVAGLLNGGRLPFPLNSVAP